MGRKVDVDDLLDAAQVAEAVGAEQRERRRASTTVGTTTFRRRFCSQRSLPVLHREDVVAWDSRRRT